MPKQQILVSAFQDAKLGMTRYRSFPFIQDETAQSHLYRVMEFWNIDMWDNSSTNAISKEVILTLLQCAARLYEDETHAKAAVDLIESTHTRAILSLGIPNAICRVANQQYVDDLRFDQWEERHGMDHRRRAEMSSTMQNKKARQLDQQTMIFKHISTLCHSHSAALQNTFDIPRIDERFMFQNYVTLSKNFNRYEKSWLVRLLPDIFKWEGQDSGDGANGGGSLAPNFGATKEAKQEASASKTTSSPPPVTSFLYEPDEFNDRMSQKEERRPIGIKIGRKDTSNYHEQWKDSLLSPSSDIVESNSDPLKSGDDSDSIFRFSPDASTNDKLLSNLPEDADNKQLVRIFSAKARQQAFSSVNPTYFQSTSRDKQRWSNMLKPGEWMGGHQNETGLITIPEEPQGQVDVEDRHNGPDESKY